jgi:sugar/nucleoside kinase (ribokinase family)
VASLGARAAFVGKVKHDELGRAFAHDIRAAGVAFDAAPASAGPSTGRCYVLVSPDGERTMNTFLGAAQDLHPNDIDPDAIAGAGIVYLEGYLWDPPHAKEAFLKAAKIAHGAERLVALTLSDAFCVDRYRAEFLDLIRSRTVDLVFANERELHSLYETADFDSAVKAIRNDAMLAVVTRSEKGCLVITREETQAVHAAPIEKMVDATGAGDLFAAGFMVGLSREVDYRDCARLGALAAAEVIQHLGARPETSLKGLAAQEGFEL